MRTNLRTMRYAAAILAFLGGSFAIPSLANPVALGSSIQGLRAGPYSPLIDRPSYADVVDLTDSAVQVLRAEIRKMTPIRSGDLTSLPVGWGRFFMEARVQALLSGPQSGENVRYLVDLPLDAKGKPLKLKKQTVLLFARPVMNMPGELQLVGLAGQIVWDADTEAMVRSILTQKLSEDAPTKVREVREVLHVPGTLMGEGETQIFLTLQDDSAAAITVNRAASGAITWSATFSELMGGSEAPPAKNTIEWQRLACGLPREIPVRANISDSAQNRAIAAADYRRVLADLGECKRVLPRFQ